MKTTSRTLLVYLVTFLVALHSIRTASGKPGGGGLRPTRKPTNKPTPTTRRHKERREEYKDEEAANQEEEEANKVVSNIVFINDNE
jgi:hypothetical protein